MGEQEVGVVGRLQRGLLTLLRIAIGWHFLYEGHAKFFSDGWTSAGYLEASRWILGDTFQWMASHPAVIALVDAVNIGGQILIGLLLVTGTLSRAASLAAIALLLLYYLANPPLVGIGLAVPADGHYLVVDRNLIELLTLAFLAALPATFLPGVDRWFLRRRQAALAGQVEAEAGQRRVGHVVEEEEGDRGEARGAGQGAGDEEQADEDLAADVDRVDERDHRGVRRHPLEGTPEDPARGLEVAG